MSAAVRRARPWLGTLVELRVEGLREPDALAAIGAAFAEVAEVHRLMSFHESSSDLARIHRGRAGGVVTVDTRTAEVLRCALRVAEFSGGAFDPSIAARAVACGSLPWPDSPFVPDAQASWRDIELLDAHSVRLRRPLWLDLGGIAKGYAVDRAVEILMRVGATQACVNAGGDIRIAGIRAEVVTLRVAHCDATHALELSDGAIATSDAASMLAREGRALPTGHADCVGVSVAAPSCMLADALTKVVLLADADTVGAALQQYGAQALLHAREGWREPRRAA